MKTLDYKFVVMMTGFQGCGKTTLARKIASLTGASLIANHDIRKSFVDRNFSLEDLFTPQMKAIVSQMALDLGAKELNQHRSIILDAMHPTRESRAKVYQLASQYSTFVITLECVCPDIRVVEQRTLSRVNSVRPEDEGDSMVYYKSTKAIYESIYEDRLFGLQPNIISYNSIDNSLRIIEPINKSLNIFAKVVMEAISVNSQHEI